MQKLIPLLVLFISCNSRPAADYSAFSDSIVSFTQHNAEDIKRLGPIAWLDYFEKDSLFFMVSDGKIVFHNYEEADTSVQLLTKQFNSIDLQWQHAKTEVMDSENAFFAADFEEALKNISGGAIHVKGYCTGIIHNTSAGLKWRNLHWSISSPMVSK